MLQNMILEKNFKSQIWPFNTCEISEYEKDCGHFLKNSVNSKAFINYIAQ